MARYLQGQEVSVMTHAARRRVRLNSDSGVSQSARRLYKWFSAHDPDNTYKYPEWDDMSPAQRAWWEQAASATLEDA